MNCFQQQKPRLPGVAGLAASASTTASGDVLAARSALALSQTGALLSQSLSQARSLRDDSDGDGEDRDRDRGQLSDRELQSDDDDNEGNQRENVMFSQSNSLLSQQVRIQQTKAQYFSTFTPFLYLSNFDFFLEFIAHRFFMLQTLLQTFSLLSLRRHVLTLTYLTSLCKPVTSTV